MMAELMLLGWSEDVRYQEVGEKDGGGAFHNQRTVSIGTTWLIKFDV